MSLASRDFLILSFGIGNNFSVRAGSGDFGTSGLESRLELLSESLELLELELELLDVLLLELLLDPLESLLASEPLRDELVLFESFLEALLGVI